MADLLNNESNLEDGPKLWRNTRKWWQAKTGWDRETYDYRQYAVIAKIREKWPDQRTLNGKEGKGTAVMKLAVRNWLRPLVVSFNDTDWPAKATATTRLELQLKPYVAWAYYLDRTYSYQKHSKTTLLPPSTNVLPHSFVTLASKKQTSATTATTASGADWSDTSSTTGSDHIQKAGIGLSEANVQVQISQEQNFNWDNVEVRIEVDVIGNETIWIPMYDLKPSPRRSPCHWADFRLRQLYKQLSQEVNLRVEPESYNFIYLNQPGEFTFNREGAYRVALKRFSLLSPSDNILHLHLKQRSYPVKTAVTDGFGLSRQTSIAVSGVNTLGHPALRLTLTPSVETVFPVRSPQTETSRSTKEPPHKTRHQASILGGRDEERPSPEAVDSLDETESESSGELETTQLSPIIKAEYWG